MSVEAGEEGCVLPCAGFHGSKDCGAQILLKSVHQASTDAVSQASMDSVNQANTDVANQASTDAVHEACTGGLSTFNWYLQT